MSKQQYELGASSKTSEKKNHTPEVEKVCHDTFPSFVPLTTPPPYSPDAISLLV